jgi:drug/metabolite transporter (DMT)-like permease
MLHNHRSLGLLLGLVAVVMFGGSLPATRIAVAHLDPWFVTAARATIGGVLALGALAVARPRYPREHTARLALISACLVIGFPAMMAIASVTVPAAHGSVILGLLPLATTVAAVPLARERPSLFFWILSLAGAALVAAFALRDGNVAIVTGDVFLALSVTLTGVGYTLSGVMSRTMPGWQVIAWALLMALPLAIIATVALWPADAASVPLSSWIGLIYVGAFSQFIGYAFWNVALAIGGVARIGQLQLLQTFVSIGLAALLIGEHVDAETIAFALAVVIVVALGRRAAVRSTASSP